MIAATLSCGRAVVLMVLASALLAGCGSNPPAKPEQPVTVKPAEPAVSPELQSAADALLGMEAKVLASGDLAKNGQQQLVAKLGFHRVPVKIKELRKF